jgi:hypothetical protein
MPTIIVATRGGLHSFDEGGDPRVEHAERSVTALGRAGDAFWAIVDASELWLNSGADRSHVADLVDVSATCVAGIGGDVLVGSSEARLFRLEAGRLEPVAAFDRAEGREAWYTPWGGPPDTRSIANWDDDIYVNVHVGGILRTDDGGTTWSPTIDVDADVHQVTTTEDLVLAACAGGLASSGDSGTTWTHRTEGLEASYSRAVAVCGDGVLVTASSGPRGGRAAVYRGALTGGAFERCRTGLPEWFDDNIDSHCLDALPDGSFAAFGTSEGRLFETRDQGATWTERASGLAKVQRVLVMP